MRWFLFPISPHLGLGFLLPHYYLVAIVLDRVLPCSGLCLSWATALSYELTRTQGDPPASASSVLGLRCPNTSSFFLSRSSTLVTTPGGVRDPLHFKCSDYTGCRPLHGLSQLPSRKMPVHATILTVSILTLCIVAQYNNGYIDTVLPRHTHPRKQISKGYIMYHKFCASQI